MSEPNQNKTLAGKILMASAIIGKIEKAGTNSHFRFSYQQWDDVVVAVREACLEVSLCLVPSAVLLDSSTKDVCNVQLSVLITDAETGETMTATWIGQSATDQFSFQKALSSAYKYFLLKTFLIPTKDDVDEAGDPDADARRPAPRRDTPRNSHVPNEGAPARKPSGGGTGAFGFVPEREPFRKGFEEAPSEKQTKMMRAKGKDRHVTDAALPWLVLALTLALGQKAEERGSKAATGFAIDFLIGSTPDQLDAAKAEALALKGSGEAISYDKWGDS